MNGLSAPCAATWRRPAGSGRSPPDARAFGFSSNATIWPLRIEAEDPHPGRIVRRDRLRGDRDVGLAIDVRLDEIAEVHPVEMIARENQVVVGIVRSDVARGLANRVGRSLEPVGVVGRLLGRQDLDEAVAEQIHAIGLGDVAVERRGIELRQHEDAAELRMQAIADRNVDQAVLSADRDGRLGPVLRQRKQPRSLPAAENEREDFVVHGHDQEQMVPVRCNVR